MIKITSSKVFLASVQVPGLYGWLAHRSVHLQRLKKNIFIKTTCSAWMQRRWLSKASFFPPSGMCCAQVFMLQYADPVWERHEKLLCQALWVPDACQCGFFIFSSSWIRAESIHVQKITADREGRHACFETCAWGGCGYIRAPLAWPVT